MWRDGGAQAGVAATDERGQAALDRPAVKQDVPAAAEAMKADIGAESVDQPLASAARMRSLKSQDIAEVQL